MRKKKTREKAVQGKTTQKPEIEHKLGCLFYEVLITHKGLFVIVECRNLLSSINKRPKCLESLAQSVCKMCLHSEDSDPN